MAIVTSLLDGVRRVIQAPVILAGAAILTLLLALPLGLVLHGALQTALGTSVAADAMADGVAWDWWEQFITQATGLERSFTPGVIGFAAVFGNLSALFDGDGQEPVIVAVVVGYLVVWTMFAGGVIDRYARNRATRSAGFFSACGQYGARLLRLAIVAGVAYGFLFGVVHGWLLDGLYGWMTRDLTVERHAFAIRVALYVVFALMLVAVSLVFDYARVRAVVEDRRSMLGALLAWVAIRAQAARCVHGALPGQRAGAACGDGDVRAAGAGRRWNRPVVVARVPDRSGLRDGASSQQAPLLRGRDRLFPEPAGARRLRRRAGAGLAGIARRRGDRAPQLTMQAVRGPATSGDPRSGTPDLNVSRH